MWFWLSLIALLCWSGSDLFSKIGCRDADDKLAHLKMVIAVGIVMGLHAAYEIFIGGVSISWHVIWTYLPVSLLYIVSMALGYIGLRYIELSISSPICNASGAVVAVLYLCFGGLDEDLSGGMRIMALAAMLLTWKAESHRISLTFPPFKQVRMVCPSISIRHCLFVVGLIKVFSIMVLIIPPFGSGCFFPQS